MQEEILDFELALTQCLKEELSDEVFELENLKLYVEDDSYLFNEESTMQSENIRKEKRARTFKESNPNQSNINVFANEDSKERTNRKIKTMNYITQGQFDNFNEHFDSSILEINNYNNYNNDYNNFK